MRVTIAYAHLLDFLHINLTTLVFKRYATHVPSRVLLKSIETTSSHDL